MAHSKPSLEAGLTALKQENYQTAKAILKAVSLDIGDRNTYLQAQVGLAVAYARCGESAAAIAVCQVLVESNHPQIKQWAENSLHDLTKRQNDDIQTTINTGFVAFDPPPSTPIELNDLQVREVVFENTFASSRENQAQSASAVEVDIPRISWRQAGRAKVWQPLPKFNLIPLRLLAAGTFMAVFWMLRGILIWVMGAINGTLIKLPYLKPLQFLYSDPSSFLFVGLLIFIGVSPWLLDWIFFRFYNQKPLEKETLNRYSKEAVRVLQRYCQQKRLQLPKLHILPLATPLVVTYGGLPRNARIVVSQGLLEQLADDEIASIYAGELGHIAYWDFAIMSLVLLVTIPIYSLYQQFSRWGDTRQGKIWKLLAAVIASIAYGIWCLFTGTALWLSKLRLYYSDRFATDITGNPNAMTRALLKIAIGIADDVEKQEQTPRYLESLNIVIPVGYQQSLTLGSVACDISWESLLMWDVVNPWRRWLAVNNTHPLIGCRTKRLGETARHWHIEPELYQDGQTPIVKRRTFALQTSPFLGIPLGLTFAVLIWLIWQIAFAIKLLNLKWIYDDWAFVGGCILIGFSIGTIVRLNYFFPQIKSTNVQTPQSLPELLANPTALPVQSINVRLLGKLLGRPGTNNCLGQDLILQTSTGLVKLHHIPLVRSLNPQDLVGRQVTVTGWLRRGATPWVDIQSLQTQSGKTIHSHHPLWSTFLAVSAQAWGAYILIRG